MIAYLKHSQIDRQQWDQCIKNSRNRLIYAFSWYLDVVSPGWEALVDAEYRAVMPLPVKRKCGLPYLVQPVFTQQLGVFSVNELSLAELNRFMRQIPKKFFRQIFNLNSANILPPSIRLADRINYELDLNPGYEQLARGYHENTRRNIRKARNSGMIHESSAEIHSFIGSYAALARNKPSGNVLEQLTELMRYAVDNQLGEIYLARKSSGEVISGAFFLKDEKRIIYMASFTSTEGQERSAMFLLVDEVIRKYARMGMILDFEGSMIPGVARFFAGFGAEARIYQQYRKGLLAKWR